MMCLGPAAGERIALLTAYLTWLKSQTRILYHLSGSVSMATLQCMFVVTACITSLVRLHSDIILLYSTFSFVVMMSFC